MDAPLSITSRIEQLVAQMSYQLFEKERIVRLALLSAMAGESIFLLGPPGVAKSMVARRLKYAFHEARSFEYLMGKFSTPDEVFGPVSISKLKNEDKYERLTEKYLPGANIVFLDEIWKASPPIQNSLLTVLNEKIYRNGEQEFSVDIRGLIAASNELPLQGEGLDALWDRFLVRMMVGNIEEEELFSELLSLPGKQEFEDPVQLSLKITDEEYVSWGYTIGNVAVPDHILGLIHHLRRTIRQRNGTSPDDQHMYVSDRRWRKVIHLLRTSAFLNGRNEIHVMDCFLIADCLWDQVEQIEEAHDLVLGSITSYGYSRLVHMGPIRRELEALRTEIRSETQIVEQEQVEVKKIHRDKAGNAFYCLQDLWTRSKGFIRVADFEKIQQEKEASLPVLEESGKVFRLSQTFAFSYESEQSLRYNDRLVELETESESREKIITKPASDAHQNIWDTEIQLMLSRIETGIHLVEERRKEDEPYLLQHLFVSATHADHVMDSLQTTTHELLNLKLEIQKVQHSYESLESN